MSIINKLTNLANIILYQMICDFQQLSTNIMSYLMSINISKIREIFLIPFSLHLNFRSHSVYEKISQCVDEMVRAVFYGAVGLA